MQHPPANQTPTEAPSGTVFSRKSKSELLLWMTWKPECCDTLDSQAWKLITVSSWGGRKAWVRKWRQILKRLLLKKRRPVKETDKKAIQQYVDYKRCISQHISQQVLGSSSLTEGSDGEKVASPLISRSEPQGRNTLTDERCLCNTRLPCIMIDVYFSDKRLSSTSSHPSIRLLTCSIATREPQ